MLISKPSGTAQPGVSSAEDNRWDEIWRLVLHAEQKEESERREFVRTSASDDFVAGQALAILEGSASLMTRGPSLASESPEERFIPQTGVKVGRYRIGTLLGEGSTGSVYSAWDDVLYRPVAIKFFARRKAGQGAANERPLREARAASALNHPNIIMIHEVIEAPQTAAIVMELVEGQTLRELAAGSRPPLGKVLHWCGQLASALAVAHRSQLIHGDLKPENVMVREDGYVKLLDFGLAIGSTPGERTPSAPLTGTLRYLSPEQYLGEPATQTSDVFALGVMLYELTTGKYPFEAANAFELMQKISAAEVARSRHVNPQLPPALDELIAMMMARTPAARPPAAHAADVLAGVAGTLERQGHRRQAWWTKPALAVGAAAVLASGVLLVRGPERKPMDVSRLTIRPLASQVGMESNPAISPDGHWVALHYRASLSDPTELQIHSTQGNPLTTVDTAGLDLQGPPAWSPDGSQLVLAALDTAQEPHLYVTGRGPDGWSAPRKIARCAKRNLATCGVDWSPDGTQLVVADGIPGKSEAELYLMDLAGKRGKTLVPPGPNDLSRPRFSPDGKTIAFSRQASLTTDELCVIDAAGGPVRRVTTTPWFLKGFTWSSQGDGLIAISARQSDRVQLWHLPLAAGAEPYRMGDFDLGRGSSPSIARKAGTLTWVRDMSTSSMWRVPLTGGGEEVKLTGSVSRDTDADWSSDGRIVFRSDRSGAHELWITRADGSRPQQATRFRGPQVGDPHWSPDGQSIAFSAQPGGSPVVFAMRCESADAPCGPPRQLTRTPNAESNPTWSRDGRWIYFASNRTGEFEVWRQAADGSGEPVRVTWNGGYLSRESADGKWLYFSKIKGRHGFYRLALPLQEQKPAEEEVAVNVPWGALGTWASSSTELLYWPSLVGVPFSPVRALNLQTRTSRNLPVVKAVLGRGLSVSADGRWLLETREDRRLSLAMIAEESR